MPVVDKQIYLFVLDDKAMAWWRKGERHNFTKPQCKLKRKELSKFLGRRNFDIYRKTHIMQCRSLPSDVCPEGYLVEIRDTKAATLFRLNFENLAPNFELMTVFGPLNEKRYNERCKKIENLNKQFAKVNEFHRMLGSLESFSAAFQVPQPKVIDKSGIKISKFLDELCRIKREARDISGVLINWLLEINLELVKTYTELDAELAKTRIT